MYEVANGLMEIFSILFQGYCLQYFYGGFLESRMHDRRINGLVVTALYGLLRLGMGILLPENYGGIGIFAKLAVVVCMISVVALVFYRVAGKICIFLIVAFMAVSEISVFLAYTVGQIVVALIPLWDWCMEKGYIVSDGVFSVLINATVVGTTVLRFLAVTAFLYYPLKSVVRFFREKNFCISSMELLFLTVPSLTGVLICSLLRTILLTIEDGVQKQIYDRYPSLIIIVPAILLLSLVAIVFGVKLFQDMVCWNREKSNRIILEKQVSSLQEHMGEMERVYSGVRG